MWPSAEDKRHKIKVGIKGGKNGAAVESSALPATWPVALLQNEKQIVNVNFTPSPRAVLLNIRPFLSLEMMLCTPIHPLRQLFSVLLFYAFVYCLKSSVQTYYKT